MNGERRFRACVLATALLGQFAYAMAAEKPLFIGLGIVAGVFSARQVAAQMAGKSKPVSRAMLNGLVLAAIAHLVYQLVRAGRQEPITSLTDFLSYVMLVKMLDRGRMRDEAQLLGLSLFVVIGSLLTGQSLALGIALMLYTPMAILCTVMLQVFVGRERIGNRLTDSGIPGGRAELDAAITRSRGWRSLLRTGAACVGMSMAAGVVGFMLTPRQLAQIGGAMGPLNKSASTTGFSDTMKLGDSGVISRNTEAVMDVAVRAEAGDVAGLPALIYLRGAVLDTYKANGEWTSREGARSFDVVSGPPSVRWERPDAPPRATRLPLDDTPRRLQRYEIVLRNAKNGKIPLFVPLQPVVITADASLSLEYSRESSLVLANSQSGRLAYTVTSSPDYYGSLSPNGPIQQFSPAIKALADDILSKANIERAELQEAPAAVRHAAQAVVAHLGKFQYTLEMVASPADKDPLEEFLFVRKAGHCEYFASGMTALMDSMGVPARVVTGYVAAEYNPVSGRYTVRQSDAHAWVEVQTTQGRWETFDPTPPGELPSTQRRHSGPLAWAQNLWDAFEFSWLDNVVAYDKGIRIDLSGPRTGDAAARWQQWLLGLGDKARVVMPNNVLGRSVVIGVAVFGIVMIVFGAGRVGAKALRGLGAMLARAGLRRGRRAQSIVITEQTRFYKHALDALTEGGAGKPETVTPLLHAAEGVMPRSAEAAGAFERVTRLYYAARFGGQAPSDADRQNAETDVRLLRQKLVKAPAI